MDGWIYRWTDELPPISLRIHISIHTLFLPPPLSTAKDFIDIIQHLPGHAAPVVDEEIHRRRYNKADEENVKKDKKDGDGDNDEDPCKDNICVVEYPSPIHCQHSSHVDNTKDAVRRNSNDVDVDDNCNIKLEQDNLTYSGKISEGRHK